MKSVPIKQSIWLNPITLIALVEFWERFNKYALRSFLVLYLISPTIIHHGHGLGWSISRSLNVYGIFVFGAYFFPVTGGIIGDKAVGSFKATVIGSIFIAVGQVILSQAFYTTSNSLVVIGLTFFAFGNGLFKPNIAKLVGEVGFRHSIPSQKCYSQFFIITNFGGIISGLSLGLIVTKLNSNYSAAFLISSVGMLLGALILLLSHKNLNVSNKQNKRTRPRRARLRMDLSSIQRKSEPSAFFSFGGSHWIPAFAGMTKRKLHLLVRSNGLGISAKEINSIIFILIIGFFTIFFWTGYQQMSGSLNIVLHKLTNRNFAGLEIPVAWFQSITPLFNVGLTLLFKRQLVGTKTNIESIPKRVLICIVIAGVSFFWISYTINSAINQNHQICMYIILLIYIGFSVGEVILSPTCLSSISQLIPHNKTSLILGVWFLFYGISSYLSGLLGKLINPNHQLNISNHVLALNLISAYQSLSIIILVGGAILWFARKPLVGLVCYE